MKSKKIIQIIIVTVIALIVVVIGAHLGGSAIDMVRAHLSGAGK